MATNDVDTFEHDVRATLAKFPESASVFLPFFEKMIEAHHAFNGIVDEFIEIDEKAEDATIARGVVFMGVHSIYHQLLDIAIQAVGNIDMLRTQLPGIVEYAEQMVSLRGSMEGKKSREADLSDVTSVFMRHVMHAARASEEITSLMGDLPNQA